MKYYLIAGEASGDLHAANLMKELKKADKEASFRFFGGDKMKEAGGQLVKHYKELAFMGFIPVLMNLRTIYSNMRMCKADILEFNPDVLILVDYPGFNLEIAQYVSTNTNIQVFYYISPKIWAWKEYRIKSIKKYIEKMFSILPFEVEFYKKHNYDIEYVGNPTVEEINEFKTSYNETHSQFIERNKLENKPIIAVLAGSRKQEIKSNLAKMLEAASKFDGYQTVIAGAPGINKEYYSEYISGKNVKIVFGETYKLLSHSTAALVTSGTATLETALFNVPQVVCYHVKAGKFMMILKKIFIKVKFISLVNLIAGKEVVRELIADKMNVAEITAELNNILNDKDYKDNMLKGYSEMSEKLGINKAAQTTATKIIEILRRRL